MDNQTPAHQKWFNYAVDDLAWTKANLNEKVWYGACFTAQQAGEKALKAYLISKETNIKKIHDLTALLEECIKTNKDFEELREACTTLTDYYAPARYPDIAEFVHFTQEKAEEAYSLAKKIVEFIGTRLS